MPQVKIGTVVSTKMLKTIVVEVESIVKHPLYKKRIKRSKNIKAQNEIGANIGDKVRIVETRPISKGVNFKVLEVIKKQNQ